MENAATASPSELVFARLGKDLSTTSSTVAAAEIILNAADELIGWEASYLILYDPAQGGRPRPLLTIDTVNSERRFEYDAVPEKPSENMLKAIREDGFLSLYENAFEIAPSLSFGDRTQRTLSQLFVPVRSGERTIGVLSIQSYSWHAYDNHSLEMLKNLSNHCAGAMERVWAQEALVQLVERLKVLYQAAHAISASLDMDELCNAIHITVEKVMPCDDFVIDGYDSETNEILPIYAVEFPRRRIQTEKYIADHGMAGRIVHTREPLWFNSMAEMNESGISFEISGAEEKELTQSIMAVPMILHGKVTGMISAQSYKENAYTPDDKYLLELLASHAAIAIENSRLFSTIQTLADTDPLTGTLTRRKFFELAEREFSLASQFGSQEDKHFSIIVLDVDEFKKFNDSFGHQVGDIVLKLVAKQCKSSLRDMDIFGRLGGEEFAVALPNTHLDQAVQIAVRLCRMVEESDLSEAGTLYELSTGEKVKREIKVTVSVGVAMCDVTCRNIDILMDHADRAMYSVKNTGRNRINVWKSGE